MTEHTPGRSEAAFHEIEVATPQLEDVRSRYEEIHRALDEAETSEARLAALRIWDELRREIDTWQSLVHLRFHQDTTHPDYRAARDACDELSPKLTELSVGVMKKLLAAPYRSELEEVFGPQAFSLWNTETSSFDPIIEERLVLESKLSAQYTELQASAEIEFRGETLNLSGIRKYTVDPDRETRHEAERARWGWYAENGPEFDRIFDELTRLRTGMAKDLGYPSFVELGYCRMARTDYSQADVERFRAQVRDNVVPLCEELCRRRAEALGVPHLQFWDEGIHDIEGNPSPQGDHDWLLGQAQEMFDDLGGGLGEFFSLMRERHLLDLQTRQGKASGGFCTSFPTEGVPFIFANFNGTKGDVEVFTHEMGHAFQCYSSRNARLLDYLWPTYESCEIHSMSLEFLTWPFMELFFGDQAERFRRIHLAEQLLFLPYGVAVDHFQHLVYERPDATPAERRAMWQEMERTYLPWRDYGDLGHPGGGGMWQAQRHIYAAPFYYIDYTLALTCALQFWVRAEKNRDAAVEAYVKLCERGGEAPFQELARSAGLTSPFEPGCLEEVVGKARETLGV